MASNTHAYRHYASAPIKSSKDAEIEIILDTTRRLSRAYATQGTDYASFALALQDNRKLWITLATDVATSGNLLSADLRAKIFYLAEFTQDYTRKVLSKNLSPEPLLDVNLAILRGLTPDRSVA
jgi:flagellar protein FlaF